MNVLLVDDEPAILHSTKLLLEGMGHHVVATPEATEVPHLVEAHKPDVLIQDVRMPGLDLRKLLETVRSTPEGRQMRVALFSAGLDLEDIADAMRVDCVLEKPFTLPELAAVLEG